MKIGKFEILSKRENPTPNIIGDSSIYDNRSIEDKKETAERFDEFLLSVKKLDYWKSIKDPRFEQYGGREIKDYQNDVGLLGYKREQIIKNFLLDNDLIYQQGKFLKLLRKKLNELNFFIDSKKSSIKINKNHGENVKEEESILARSQKIFDEYNILIDNLLSNSNLNYVVYCGLINLKRWMDCSWIKQNEEYEMPFRHFGNTEIFFDKDDAFILPNNLEEIELLKNRYNKNKSILDHTDNYIKENSSGFFRQYGKKMDKIGEEIRRINKKDGINLKEYFTNNIFKQKDEKNIEQKYFDFLFFISKENYEFLEKDFGFNPEELSLREQFYFLDFIKDKDINKTKRIGNFSKEFGINGFRTFLSIEHGGKEMGDKILILGEKLPETSAQILFKTYGEMIDASEEVADLLRNNLGEKATPELIQKTQDSLLIGGKELLEKYAKKAESCEGVTCGDIGRELEERLSLAKKSVFAFSYACKVLVERGEFSFEDFQKAKLSYDKSPLPEKMQEQIIGMHNVNTEQYPPKLKDLWRGTLKEGLKEPNPNQLVVSASYENEIVSAMRVIQREDGSWYGASFNVNPTVQGSRIGTELLKEVLKGLAKDKPFVADCYSKNPMLKTYLDKFGFKITKEVENYHDTGELVYEITIFPEEKN